jgi:hypothetical protein
MIEFEHKLPSLTLGEKTIGTYNNYELGFPSVMTTDGCELGLFLYALRNNIYRGRRLVFIDGENLTCCHNWIRDHVHTVKAARHWEYDIRSFLDFIIKNQRDDGQFFELIKQYDDYHWKMVNPDCYKLYEEDNLTLVRLELEADVEYLVVEGAKYYYRQSGDRAWLEKVLPSLEVAVEYMTTDGKRFDKTLGLVKRPFTVDTWDFAYYGDDVERTKFDRRISPDTPMSVMHGDNSGVYSAMITLSYFNKILGNEEKSLYWQRKAEQLKDNMIKHLWGGKFFVHQLHLNHNGADDMEWQRLSLSNVYDINRGVTTLEQSRAIIEEYMSRQGREGTFAEWFSIDPPYKSFGSHKPGEYVNGAISPFTAGELAKAALKSGYEEYGYGIIKRFMELVKRDGDVYFLYYPDSKPQPHGGPSSWGAASLISAVDEGLAGITDVGVQYDKIEFSPRFAITAYKELRYITGYEKSSTRVEVRYTINDTGMRYDLMSPAKSVSAHILLPKGKTLKSLLVNGEPMAFGAVNVADSRYVDFTVNPNNGKKLSIEILF